MKMHPLVGLLILIVATLIILTVIFTTVAHLFGDRGIFTILLFFFITAMLMLDAR
jgi:hypothetical protein